MEQSKKCLCSNSDVRIVACSGASNVGQIVAIDGCPFQCAAKTLQHEEIEPAIQVIVTELGIEKSHDIALDEKASSMVVEKVKKELSS